MKPRRPIRVVSVVSVLAHANVTVERVTICWIHEQQFQFQVDPFVSSPEASHTDSPLIDQSLTVCLPGALHLSSKKPWIYAWTRGQPGERFYSHQRWILLHQLCSNTYIVVCNYDRYVWCNYDSKGLDGLEIGARVPLYGVWIKGLGDY